LGSQDYSGVVNKAAMDKLPREAAAYRVMEDIENYNKIGGLKNEISKMVMQQHAIVQIMQSSKRKGDSCSDDDAGIRGDRRGNIEYLRMAKQDTRKIHHQQIAKVIQK
jgi:hypothetical protein